MNGDRHTPHHDPTTHVQVLEVEVEPAQHGLAPLDLDLEQGERLASRRICHGHVHVGVVVSGVGGGQRRRRLRRLRGDGERWRGGP